MLKTDRVEIIKGIQTVIKTFKNIFEKKKDNIEYHFAMNMELLEGKDKNDSNR